MSWLRGMDDASAKRNSGRFVSWPLFPGRTALLHLCSSLAALLACAHACLVRVDAEVCTLRCVERGLGSESTGRRRWLFVRWLCCLIVRVDAVTRLAEESVWRVS